MNWTRAVDIYCERVSSAFWAEPVNALTNAAFLVAGLAALAIAARRGGERFSRQAALAALLALGIASALAVVIGTVWAASAGAAPLALAIAVGAGQVLFIAIALTRLPAAYREARVDWTVLWLSANAAIVGIGSFLFHTVAQPWAGAADSGPILMFIIGYFAVAMNRFAGLSWGGAAAATSIFLAGMILLSWGLRVALGDLVGGSQSYAPALVALLAIGWWLRRARGHPAGAALMAAGGVFALSLAARTADGPICQAFPLGTHFLWHLLNGVVFLILLVALVRYGRRPTAVAPSGGRAATGQGPAGAGAA